MDNVFDFNIESLQKLSSECITQNITTFQEASNYVMNLPYGRNSDRSDYTLILKEHKGTCSTKHAFLKQLAIENKQDKVDFYLGIYKMNESNTKGVGQVLSKFNLNYIPEAHTYLKIENTIVDVTRTTVSENSFIDDLILEETMLPHQIGNYKLNKHQDFLKNWITENNIPYAFEEIWNIRELCIKALS